MRLIDADTLQFVPKGTKYVVGVRGNGKIMLNLMAAVQEAVDKTPTIDAVPVVRCKDCENWDTGWKPADAEDDEQFCVCFARVTRSDEFCSRGERRCDNE